MTKDMAGIRSNPMDRHAEYFTISSVNENEMPKGLVWAFVGLPKRGKTYGISRFNPSQDITKTLFLDLEMCTLEYPEYRGLHVLPITSYTPPTVVVEVNGKKTKEIVPSSERPLYVGGKQIRNYSIIEAISIIKSMEKSGALKNFESIVIDTVDALQGLIEEKCIEEYNEENPKKPVNSIGDIGSYGSGWDLAKRRLVSGPSSVIKELKTISARTGIEIVLSIHSKTTTQIEGRVQRDPALRAGNTLALFAEVAAIGYVDNHKTSLPDGSNGGSVGKGKQHTVSFITNSEETTGGTRLSSLVGKTVPFSYQEIKKEYEKGDEQ